MLHDKSDEYLIERFVTESLSEEDNVVLKERLSKSPELARRLANHVYMDMSFRRWVEVSTGSASLAGELEATHRELFAAGTFEDLIALEKNAPVLSPRPCLKHDSVFDRFRQKVERWTRFLPAGRTMVHAVVLFLLLGVVYGSMKMLFVKSEPVATPSIARILETVDVRWGDSFEAYKKGAEIGEGKNVIKQGLLQIEFSSGSRIIVEGPATFILNHQNGLFLQQGKLSAHVPEAGRGFEVATPFVHIVDLGTEFSLDVTDKGADIHVLRGSLQLSRSSSPSVVLHANNAVSLNHQGESTFRKVDAASYLSEQHFGTLVSEYREKRESARSALDVRLESDPTLLYRLGQHNAREKVIGCREVEGSLPTKKAWRFDDDRDCIELEIPGEYRNLTMIARIKIDRIGRFSNTLFLSDSFYEQPGTFFWQIDQNGIPHWHLRNSPSDVSMFVGATAIKRTDWKTWCLMAVVLDSAGRTVRHYKDGRLIRSLPWESPKPLRIGQATIGNQKIEGKKLTPRFLNGAIEDFLIFSRTLDEKEIREFLLQP